MIGQIKTLQKKPTIMKGPAPQPHSTAPKGRPAAPKKSARASEKSVTGLGIANGMINLTIDVENLENN